MNDSPPNKQTNNNTENEEGSRRGRKERNGNGTLRKRSQQQYLSTHKDIVLIEQATHNNQEAGIAFRL